MIQQHMQRGPSGPRRDQHTFGRRSGSPRRYFILAGLVAAAGITAAGYSALAHTPQTIRAVEKSAKPDTAEAPQVRTIVLERRTVVAEPAVPATHARGDVERSPSSQQAPEEHEDVALALATQFEVDLPPTAESLQTEGVVRDGLSRLSTEGATLQNLACRATTCRAEVVLRDQDTDMRLMRKLFVEPDSPLKVNMNVTIPERTTRDDGTIAATIYLVKPDGR